MHETLLKMRSEMELDLRENILPFWMHRVMDQAGQNFAGEVDGNGVADSSAVKGSILTARMVWTFANAYRTYRLPEYLDAANLVYRWLDGKCWDHENGGVYWSIDSGGAPLETRKHVYANAFAMYAYAEYFRATGNTSALDRARTIFRLFEQHAHDPVHGGWFESYSKDWQPLDDARLAADETNAPKSMNTHLHVLEALTNLLRVWDDLALRVRLKEAIRIFLDHIIDADTHHFVLFMDQDWEPLHEAVSYGHDIEGSWLLVEAAGVLGEPDLIREVNACALNMARAVLEEGSDEDGAILYEFDPHGPGNTDKVWWAEAETVVGFLNAFELSGDEAFILAANRAWTFIQNHIIDREHGEWRYGTQRNLLPLPKELAGFWKCPYHNSRMCFEVIARIN